MKSWNATLLVCDDLLYSLTGKINLFGIYTGDIGVPLQMQATGQLVFLFLLEGDLSERPGRVTLEVSLPGESSPNRLDVGPLAVPAAAPGRTRWNLRLPFLVAQPVLRPGRIEAKIIHGKDEISVRGPWITLTGAAPTPTPAS